jgi:hypothetical protein
MWGQMGKGRAPEGRGEKLVGKRGENVISEAVKSYSFINKDITRPILCRGITTQVFIGHRPEQLLQGSRVSTYKGPPQWSPHGDGPGDLVIGDWCVPASRVSIGIESLTDP